MRIGVIGAGIVGRATARAFLEWADVRVYDVTPERRTHSLVEALDSSLIFVCLPTPQKEGSLECDTSIIDKFFAGHAGYNLNFVLRSTVPVGTTRRLVKEYDLPNLVHSPEFLTARCAVTDAQTPARNIVGGGECHCKAALASLYALRFPGVPVHLMTSDESELVKLVTNAFFAVKVAYFNEAYTLADKLGCDWQRIMAGVLSDGRIAHSHTRVPGHSGFGFSGTCLPKDLANMVHLLESHGLLSAVTMGALARNQEDVERSE